VFANEILIDKTKTSSFEPDGQLIPQRSLWSLVMVGTAMAPASHVTPVPCTTGIAPKRFLHPNLAVVKLRIPFCLETTSADIQTVTADGCKCG
jgi:hypothetical protein